MDSNLDPPHILVVEDEPLTALELTETMESMGAIVVGPAWTISRATALAHEESIDGAVLDINVSGRTSYDLAAELRDQDVPVLFVTACSGEHIPRQFRDVPVVHKPYGIGQLQRALANALGL